MRVPRPALASQTPYGDLLVGTSCATASGAAVASPPQPATWWGCPVEHARGAGGWLTRPSTADGSSPIAGSPGCGPPAAGWSFRCSRRSLGRRCGRATHSGPGPVPVRSQRRTHRQARLHRRSDHLAVPRQLAAGKPVWCSSTRLGRLGAATRAPSSAVAACTESSPHKPPPKSGALPGASFFGSLRLRSVRV
jgi:hypothetical protein